MTPAWEATFNAALTGRSGGVLDDHGARAVVEAAALVADAAEKLRAERAPKPKKEEWPLCANCHHSRNAHEIDFGDASPAPCDHCKCPGYAREPAPQPPPAPESALELNRCGKSPTEKCGEVRLGWLCATHPKELGRYDR